MPLLRGEKQTEGPDDAPNMSAEDVREDFGKRAHASAPLPPPAAPAQPDVVVDVDMNEDFTKRGRTSRPKPAVRNR